jgi:hypothetical protein
MVLAGMVIYSGSVAAAWLTPFNFGDIVFTQGAFGTLDAWYCLYQCSAQVNDDGIASELSGVWLPLGGL